MNLPGIVSSTTCEQANIKSFKTVIDDLADVANDDSLNVFNPYDNELLARINTDNASRVERAISYASSYNFHLNAWDRFEILFKFCQLLVDESESFAKIISQESGKTIKDARGEVKRAHQAFLLSAEQAKRINGEVIPVDAVADMDEGLAMVIREPLGLVCAITPFNYPLNLVAHKVGPALAANNPIIVKPSELTPLSALKMRDLLLQAGLPAQMLQVVIGDAEKIGEQLVSDHRVRKISFTGSVKVGKKISKKACMKEICMELGGNDPLIILRDADLDKALAAAVEGAYGNNGERCTSVKRLIVEDKIADEFIERFIRETRKLKVGDQLDPETDIGPLITAKAAIEIEQRVNAAVKAGATLRYGFKRSGALLSPIVLDQVNMTNPIVTTETFGPVAPFIRVSDFNEAIFIANDTSFGLQSGVFTNDYSKAMQAVAKIKAGAVMINKAPGFRAEHLPFGGVKDSGLGREGIKYAVDSMTTLKTVVF